METIGMLLLAGLCIGLIVAFLFGAWFLLVCAAEQGFIGLILYVAAWFFMAPAMLVICTIAGVWGGFGLYVSRA